jgi:D-beta-D-heptose 7-phosphate kinase / D-beta-D-heptose 1-phosphate adenosyltransferase
MDLNALKSIRVAVVGDLILDRYWMGKVKRISPEAPVPILSVKDNDDRLGGAANLAVNLTGLGCDTHLIGCLAEDESGHKIKSLCEKSGVKLHYVKTKEPSTVKIRLVEGAHQIARADFEAVLSDCYQERLLEMLEKIIDDVDVIALSDYDKGVLADPQRFIQLAKSKGVPVLVDPKNKDWSCYKGVDIIKPNLSEFRHVMPSGDLDSVSMQTIDNYDFNTLVLTQGSEGINWYSKKGVEKHESIKVDVFDVTGAGDTVMSILTATHTLGWTPSQRMNLASQAAAIVIQHTKTTPIDLNEINLLQSEDKIISKEQATAFAKAVRGLNKRLVVTNGCFDLLHPGHVRYLQQAKNQGDQLWVLVNSDASIKRLKGPMRPINKLSVRMEMLSCLSCVDRVIAFDEDTPGKLIEAIRPNVLVKGGDYTEETIAGAKFVQSYGGSVSIIPLIGDYSSTQIIECCKKS